MQSSKATQEINKARIHLLKAKKEMSQYSYEGQQLDLTTINRIIDKLELLSTSANAHSVDVIGGGKQTYLRSIDLLERSKFK